MTKSIESDPIDSGLDCCEIYDISDLQRLQQQYAKFRASRGSPPYPKSHKYLLVKKFFAPEINLHYDGRDGPKYFAVQQYAPRIYALNACGHMSMQKEKHVKVKDGFY